MILKTSLIVMVISSILYDICSSGGLVLGKQCRDNRKHLDQLHYTLLTIINLNFSLTRSINTNK